MSLSIELSTRNFKEVAKINGNKEFCFIIGEEKVFCHKFVAAFLSRPILQNLISDPTASSFSIDFKSNGRNSELEHELSENLKKLINGEKIEISSDEIQKFNTGLGKITKETQLSEISSTTISSLLILNESFNNDELNNELYKHLFSMITINNAKSNSNDYDIEQEITQLRKIENFFKIIKNNQSQSDANFRQYLEEKCQEKIGQLASHFYQIDENNFNQMNQNLIDLILSSQKLKIKSEDSLLHSLINRRKYLLSKENSDDDCEQPLYFLEKVRFEYLSQEAIELFLNEIQLSSINEQIWTNIKKRLVLPVQLNVDENQRFCGNDFKYDSRNPLNGIFQYLTKKTGGNIQNNKTIEISCSKLCCGTIDTIVNLNDSKGHTHVNGSPTPRWLKVDFKNRKIHLNSYVIKSCDKQSYGGDFYALKSWKIEISNDGSSWNLIDTRENVSELNGELKMQVFNITNKHEPFRFIRIITDKDNWQCADGFVIGRLELFGQIIE